MTRSSLLLATLLCLVPTPAFAQSYVIAAPGGGAILRVVTGDAACPVAQVDGAPHALAERSGPRDDTSRAAPSAFPLRVCEVPLARDVRQVRVENRSVPVLPRVVRRIVVIGDTGCRLKAATDAWQACNDPRAWPFARVARVAAAMRPDLVLHVGDYDYRENACPEDKAGCAGSPHGYGWDAWRADFLTPAAPLLTAAPWVMVRGNHEECARAGLGWWILLDPHALETGADCSDPARYFAGDHRDPYAVELGGQARLIVADLSAMGEKPLIGAALARYTSDAARIRDLARVGDTNFVTAHYPFGAVTGTQHKGFRRGIPAIGQAFGTTAPALVPDLPAVTAMLAGHVHMLQYVADHGHPTQLVIGFSGTQEDAPKAPATVNDPGIAGSLPSVTDLASRFGQYGFGLMTRRADGRWNFTAYDQNGKVLLRRKIARAGD